MFHHLGKYISRGPKAPSNGMKGGLSFLKFLSNASHKIPHNNSSKPNTIAIRPSTHMTLLHKVKTYHTTTIGIYSQLMHVFSSLLNWFISFIVVFLLLLLMTNKRQYTNIVLTKLKPLSKNAEAGGYQQY